MHQVSGRWKLGLSLALCTALGWGVLPVALKLLLEGMDAITVTWYRFGSAVVVLGIILALTGKLPNLRTLTRQAWWLLLIALLGLVGNYVFYLLALNHVSPTVNQTVIQLSPTFLLLGGLVVFKERFTRGQWIGFIFLVGGLLLFFNTRLPELTRVSGGLGLGVLFLLIAAIVWAGYALAQKFLLKSLNSQQVLWVIYVGASVLLLPFSRLGTVTDLTSVQLGLLAFACINTLLAYGAFAEALEHWEVSRVGAVLALSPLFTLTTMWLMGIFAPHLVEPDRLNALSIVGALFVVSGSMLCALAGRNDGPTAQAVPPNGPVTS